MSEHRIEIPIPLDSDGFMSLECPHCENRFKLRSDEAQDETVFELHCPICGLSGEPNTFWTSEAVEAVRAAAQNAVQDMFYEEIKRMERRNRGKSFIQIKAGQRPKSVPQLQIVENEEFDIHTFECCDKRAKVHPASEALILRCPYCGLPE